MRKEMKEQSFMLDESDGLRLKLYMIKLLEATLKDISGEEDGRISDINFAYHNSWLLE